MKKLHQLQNRQQELLDELDEIEEAIAESMEGDEQTIDQEQLSWLQRQHAGVLVLLNETERMLLESGADNFSG